MTMKRNAKTEALTKYAATAAKPQPALTPTQLRTYGNRVPGKLVALPVLRSERETSRRDRKTWAAIRVGRRSITRR